MRLVGQGQRLPAAVPRVRGGEPKVAETAHKQLVTRGDDDGPPAATSDLPHAGLARQHRLLPVTSYQSQATSYKLQVTT